MATVADAFDVSYDLFARMVEQGLIPEGRRVYLWDGGLREKMAKTVAHAIAAVAIGEASRRRLPPGWLLWPENPIRLDARHAPLPDVPVVRGSLDDYRRANRHPVASDVGLLVEVSVTSLSADLGEVAEKYASALVPAYWVADVAGRRVIAHRAPRVVKGRGNYAGHRAVRARAGGALRARRQRGRPHPGRGAVALSRAGLALEKWACSTDHQSGKCGPCGSGAR